MNAHQQFIEIIRERYAYLEQQARNTAELVAAIERAHNEKRLSDEDYARLMVLATKGSET